MIYKDGCRLRIIDFGRRLNINLACELGCKFIADYAIRCSFLEKAFLWKI